MAVQPTTASPSPSHPHSPSPSAAHPGDTFTTIASTSALDSRIDESDLDPAAFLKSVRELSEKREREDSERVRRLEEEIEKGRQERARRREGETGIDGNTRQKLMQMPAAERARSISPEKTDQPQPRPLSSRHDSKSISSPPSETPPRSSSSAAMDADGAEPVPEFKGFGSAGNSDAGRASTETSKPVQSAASLARSGTLSWQRRPASRGANSRPQSMVLEGQAQANVPSTEEPEKSRDQIAASLGSRDPSWFRQTADRGVGNAAYRRNKDEMAAESTSSGRRGLPGMSREASGEPTREASPAPSESVRSEATSRPSTARDSTFSSAPFSTTRTSTSSKPDLKSLIAADKEQEKASPMSDQASSVADGDQSGLGRTLTMSSSQARLANSQDRPASPTKGMGGFVSSAMMKRADSQSKRWSAQPGGSLSRQNSLASARSGYGGLQGSYSMPKLEPAPSSREASNEPASRPTSSSSNLTALTTTTQEKDSFVKPALPTHSRSKSVASTYSTTAEEGHISPPSSPSKRWSPTKSSWLESSITKPDSPKPTPARNSQPDWMTNIAKAKAQRVSGETPSKLEEEGGLRSSSPTKAMFGQGMLKRSESGGLVTPRTLTPKPADSETPRSPSPAKGTFGSSSLQRSDSRDLQMTSGRSTPATNSKPPEPAEKSEIAAPKPVESDEPAQEPSATIPAADAKPSTLPEEPKQKRVPPVKSPPPALNKPKPDTASKPQTDFRSTLRSRPPPEAKQGEQPEFLAKFGHLKKAETKNYVAPDMLKENILRGKGDLSKTGGPVKTPRRDELKESLLAKREQWKKEKEEGVVHERKTSNPPTAPQKPEALARREMMGRTGSVKQAESSEKPKNATPEALARHKSLKDKPKPDTSMPAVTKQRSEPTAQPAETQRTLPQKQTSTPMPKTTSTVQPQPSSETSKLASRFNPGLANILARGPPAQTSGSNTPSRSESPALPQRTETPSEPPADGSALQDMRKGRAKGPKKRKGGAGGAREGEAEPAAPSPAPVASEPEPIVPANPPMSAPEPAVEAAALPKPKPRAPPGSAASVMMASLQKPGEVREQPATPLKGQTAVSPEPSKPATPAKSPLLSSKTSVEDKTDTSKPLTPAAKPALFGARAMQSKPATPAKDSAPTLSVKTTEEQPVESPQTEVPDFKGFGSLKRSSPTKSSPAIRLVEDNKENVGESSPSVKSAASMWGRQSPVKRTEAPTQIQLPSKKDEEAAMRSAGLLASSPSRPGSRDGLGIALEQAKSPAQTPPPSAGAPPKPAKPSRSVSGQLRDASPNKG